ncbi:UNVERIFIED_CONTAM: hypothetical protein GTU68_043419 [Idotea baltica]|nr:hypothetical protein [Idotea baltica]
MSVLRMSWASRKCPGTAIPSICRSISPPERPSRHASRTGSTPPA